MKTPIYTCLWFDGQAKAAAEFYSSAFNHSRITSESPMVISFELNGIKFMGLNGGPMYQPNPSISLFVVCESEAEVNKAWSQLSEGGKILMPLDKYEWSGKYGWLQDKFGISWQIYLGKLDQVGQRICPLLMFVNKQTGNAEEAVKIYTSIFKNSSVDGIMKYAANAADREGLVQHAQFRLGKNVFMAMDSSMPHEFDFGEGMSFVVECDDQEEIDYFWNKLTEGGEESMCGWLKDRFGVSWQIIPAILGELMADPAKGPRVVQAFLKMKKFDIATLIRA